MPRNTTQSWIAKRLALSGEQRAHLANLDATRRRMLEIRRGRAPVPGPIDDERERKLGELRAAGRLNADQELFLRLCGPEEVDRQHALHRFFGGRYDGIVVPSLKNLENERRTQRRGVRPILRAYERGRDLARQEAPASLSARVLRNVTSVRRFLHHFGGKRRRRPARRPVRSTAASASDGSSDPPPGDDSSDPPQRGGCRVLAAQRPCSAVAVGGLS